MVHVVMYSGGVGSWAAAKRLVAKHGAENVRLLFTDTLFEDQDAYRFLIETASEIYGAEVTDLVQRTRDLPEVWDEARKPLLLQLAADTTERIPHLAWIADGRTPWELFHDTKFLGNARLAKCSHLLKQKVARKWMETHFTPEEATVHIGIDWTEEHRFTVSAAMWQPYTCTAPMCEEPLIAKDAMMEQLAGVGIERPRLYGLGFPHNNCSGACVRAGVSQWLLLLRTFPERYRWVEAQEQAFRERIGKDVAILRDRSSGAKCGICSGGGFTNGDPCPECEGTGKATRPMTLQTVRERNPKQLSLFDEEWGGCGCFLQPEPEVLPIG